MRMLPALNGVAAQSLPYGPFPTAMLVAKSVMGSLPALWPVQNVALRGLRSRRGPLAPTPYARPLFDARTVIYLER